MRSWQSCCMIKILRSWKGQTQIKTQANQILGKKLPLSIFLEEDETEEDFVTVI